MLIKMLQFKASLHHVYLLIVAILGFYDLEPPEHSELYNAIVPDPHFHLNHALVVVA